MVNAKTLFVFAGANGSGKTTLYKRHKHIFSEIPFVNADEMLKEVTGNNDPSNAKFGQELANAEIEKCFAEEKSFVFETVFSHESKIELVKRAKLLGYAVSIYFCHLSDAAQNIARVKHRIDQGGHDVPEEKIITRIPRTLENVRTALQFADDFYVFDNSYTEGHQLVAYKKVYSEVTIVPSAPDWVRDLVKSVAIGSQIISKVSISFTRVDLPKPKVTPKRHKKCVRCGRFLRGKRRTLFGVCSACEPKITR
jgi:predicted ABC-type ATPase